MEKGRIVKVEGAAEARIIEGFLKGLGDPNMYRMAHYTYGFNPGVTRLTGRIVEDERLMGCTVFGFGGRYDRPAASHMDCTVLTPTYHVDGVEIERDGKYTHPELVAICQKMGLQGY